MSVCGFGASSLKIKSMDLCSVRPKLSALQPLPGLMTPKNARFDGPIVSHTLRKTMIGCRSSISKVDCIPEQAGDLRLVKCTSKQTESTDVISPLIPNALEVEYLLTGLCDTTSIAEFELKLGGFRLYVSRDLTKQEKPLAHAPVTANTVVETVASTGSASSTSLALVKPSSSSGGVHGLLVKAADEGLAILQSPKVGFFRRSRSIKGKRAPPSCKEKDTVKEGQVLCYIEQLGGEIPIESDVGGEVVKILKKDGDPVGYGDALVALLPSFPGIKKLH